MSYQRIVKITNSEDLYKLAIVADFEEKNYSVVVVHTNHSRSLLEYHTLATFNNIQEATREYNHRTAHETVESLEELYQSTSRGLVM